MERESIGSTFYTQEDYLYITNGEAPNFFSRPYSIKKSLNPEPINDFFLDTEISLSIRSQYLNDNIPTSDQSYWYNLWIKNDPLLSLGFKTGYENFLIDSEFDIRFDFFGGFNSDTYINIPYKDYWYQDFDFNFPTRGFIVYGNDNLQLLIGRDKLKFGPGQKANLMISGDVPFFNQLNLTYQNPLFKGSFFFIPLESFLSGDEKDDIESFINSDSDLIPSGNFGKEITEQSKYLTGHRYEFRPLKNLIFSFTDMLLIGGRFPNFEDISPTMFYHNVYGENYSNVMIGFDIFWTITNGLGLYGEFIIDDIKNSFEKDYSIPTSLGALAGIKCNIPKVPGKMTLSIEGAYTDPYTYERWHPYLSFYSRRKLISTSVTENRYLDTPIGFFLGSDSMFLTVWIDYILNDNLNGSMGWEIQNKGDNSGLSGEELLLSYEEDSDRTYIISNVIYLNCNYIINENFSIDLTERVVLSESIINLTTLSINLKLK